jgi:hypothetical protein
MEAPALQWSAAEVQNATLTVPIDGDRPKGWKATFEQTVRLLGGGAWGEVSLKRGRVKVTAVTEGNEDELRHFLEGVVQQANATHVDSAGDGDEDTDAGGDAPGEGGDDADGRMTSRFRDFDAA